MAARTRECLLERRVRVHRVEGRDKAELFLDLLFGRHVRRSSVRVVVLPALCGLAQALALWEFGQDRRIIIIKELGALPLSRASRYTPNPRPTRRPLPHSGSTTAVRPHLRLPRPPATSPVVPCALLWHSAPSIFFGWCWKEMRTRYGLGQTLEHMNRTTDDARPPVAQLGGHGGGVHLEQR